MLAPTLVSSGGARADDGDERASHRRRGPPGCGDASKVEVVDPVGRVAELGQHGDGVLTGPAPGARGSPAWPRTLGRPWRRNRPKMGWSTSTTWPAATTGVGRPRTPPGMPSKTATHATPWGTSSVLPLLGGAVAKTAPQRRRPARRRGSRGPRRREAAGRHRAAGSAAAHRSSQSPWPGAARNTHPDAVAYRRYSGDKPELVGVGQPGGGLAVVAVEVVGVGVGVADEHGGADVLADPKRFLARTASTERRPRWRLRRRRRCGRRCRSARPGPRARRRSEAVGPAGSSHVEAWWCREPTAADAVPACMALPTKGPLSP